MNTNKKILIAEDDENMRKLLDASFKSLKNTEVIFAVDGDKAIFALANNPDIDLVLTDVMMPGVDGIHLTKYIKDNYKHIAVIVISAKSDEVIQVEALSLGADDYITKPFLPKVLVEKVKRSLEREKTIVADNPNVYKYKNIEIDLKAQIVTKDGEFVDLSPKGKSLLLYFIQNQGKAISREELKDNVWGDATNDIRSVDSHVMKLRKALNFDSIISIRGFGYLLSEE